MQIRILDAAISALVMLVFALPYWPANFEISKAMCEGQVTVSGGKYSFHNTLTYTVKKKGA